MKRWLSILQKIPYEFYIYSCILIYFEVCFYFGTQIPFTVSRFLLSFIYGSAFIWLIKFMTSSRIIQRIFYSFLLFFFGTLYFAQTFYISVYGSLLTVDRIRLIQEFMAAGDHAKAEFDFRFLAYYLPLCIFFLVLLFNAIVKRNPKLKTRYTSLFYVPQNHSFWEKNNKRNIKRAMVVTCILLNIINRSENFFAKDMNRKYFLDNVEYAKQYGLFKFFTKDITAPILLSSSANGMEENQKENKYTKTFAYKEHYNQMTNRYKGKNVVFLVVESLGAYGISKEVTPNMYKLQQEGIFFENMYGTSLNTYETELNLLTGFPYASTAYYTSYTKSQTLPNLFDTKGYSTLAFHTLSDYYYDRTTTHKALGFDEYYPGDRLGIQVEAPDYTSDTELFKRTPKYFKNKQPYFAYHLSVTGHSMYSKEARPKLQSYAKEIHKQFPNLSEETCYWLAGEKNTDDGIGILLKSLKKQGALKDTVIILVGDHYPYGIRQEILTKDFKFKSSMDVYKTPFLVWDASKPSKVVHTKMSNVDVYPTIANMFGLHPTHQFGQDIFEISREEGYVNFFNTRNYSIITDKYEIDRGKGQEHITGKVSEEEVQKMLEKSYNRMEVLNLYFDYEHKKMNVKKKTRM